MILISPSIILIINTSKAWIIKLYNYKLLIINIIIKINCILKISSLHGVLIKEKKLIFLKIRNQTNSNEKLKHKGYNKENILLIIKILQKKKFRNLKYHYKYLIFNINNKENCKVQKESLFLMLISVNLQIHFREKIII